VVNGGDLSVSSVRACESESWDNAWRSLLLSDLPRRGCNRSSITDVESERGIFGDDRLARY
jgi:hypothetical protein